MDIQVTGINELRQGIASNCRMDLVKKVVKLNGAELQRKAQEKAPYDSGTLRRSIDLELRDGGMTARVEAEAEYAPYQEFGTRFMEAQPYMKPAFNQQKGQFKNDLNRIAK